MRYVSEGREPSPDFLKRISDRFDISATWLLMGKGPMRLNEISTTTEFVPIPRYTVSASAGGGSFVSDPVDITYYAFSIQWIKRRSLDISQLHIVDVRGDSMEPTLFDGDLILVDRAHTEPMDGKLYVLRIAHQLVVKHIQTLRSDRIALLSANPVYPSREIDLMDTSNDLEVIGRVVASMHEW